MAKEKFNIAGELASLEKLQAEMRRKAQEVTVHCSHVSKKGEPTLKYLNQRGDVMCERCQKRFNTGEITRAELESSVNRVNDAIEQMRFASSPEQDADLIVVLGQLANRVTEVPDSYERVLAAFTQTGRKKNKKKKQQGSSFGGFSSASNISFINQGGGSGKKNRRF